MAVSVVAGGGSGAGEAIARANGELAAGAADAPARALEATETGPSYELGDTEMAEAISIIKQLRQRMNATE